MSKTQWYIGAPNAVVLCISALHPDRMEGVLYHSYSEQAVPFRNVEQMIFRMEELYDAIRFPHPGTNERSFGEVKPPERITTERTRIMSDEKLLQKHGDIGTFIVRVQHRQNSSWQGRITWMEEDKTINFRSIWEMVKLIESAVDTVSDVEDEESSTWFDTQKN